MHWQVWFLKKSHLKDLNNGKNSKTIWVTKDTKEKISLLVAILKMKINLSKELSNLKKKGIILNKIKINSNPLFKNK